MVWLQERVLPMVPEQILEVCPQLRFVPALLYQEPGAVRLGKVRRPVEEFRGALAGVTAHRAASVRARVATRLAHRPGRASQTGETSR